MLSRGHLKSTLVDNEYDLIIRMRFDDIWLIVIYYNIKCVLGKLDKTRKLDIISMYLCTNIFHKSFYYIDAYEILRFPSQMKTDISPSEIKMFM